MHSIGVVISTQGRESIVDTLMSIKSQGLIIQDRIVVVGDGIPEPRAGQICSIVRGMGPQFEFFNRPKEPSAKWGHGQVNWGLDKLHKTVDRLCVQDDDDIFAPRIFDIIREESQKAPDDLFMTRVLNHAWGLLWREPAFGVPLFNDLNGAKLAEQGITAQDGHSPILPGRCDRLPKFGDEYIGDQIYMLQCSLLFPKIQWLNIISTITRPKTLMGWKLMPILVEDEFRAEGLRLVRNACTKDGPVFTSHNQQITPDEQAAWFRNKDKKIKVWLFSAMEGDTWAGFCVVRPLGDKWTFTFGVTPEHRGKGYGREIAEFAAFAGQGPLVSNVLKENLASQHIHDAIGWEHTGTLEGNILEYSLSWPPTKIINRVIPNRG
jgi:RimJ/RimL family protein N-acetyltransferase